MTKATTPFKMFYVELPEAKPFTAKKVRCYLDLETGNVFGSKEVVSRFLHKNEKVRNSVDWVMSLAKGLMNYYWNKKDLEGEVPMAMIRGQVIKLKNPNQTTDYDSKLGFKFI